MLHSRNVTEALTGEKSRQSPHHHHETLEHREYFWTQLKFSDLSHCFASFRSVCSFLLKSKTEVSFHSCKKPAKGNNLMLLFLYKHKHWKHQYFNTENHQSKSKQTTNKTKKKLSSQRQKHLNFYYISFTNNAKIQRQKPSHKKEKIKKNVHLVELLFHIISQIANT